MAELFTKINNDIKEAMKSKDQDRLSVIRMIKSKILYVNARGDQLTDSEVTKIISKYSKEVAESVEETKKLSRNEEVAKGESELKIIKEYLPKEMSNDEIKSAVASIIKEVEATSIKDMGRVMKAIGAKYPSVDGKIANMYVRELLGL